MVGINKWEQLQIKWIKWSKQHHTMIKIIPKAEIYFFNCFISVASKYFNKQMLSVGHYLFTRPEMTCCTAWNSHKKCQYKKFQRIQNELDESETSLIVPIRNELPNLLVRSRPWLPKSQQVNQVHSQEHGNVWVSY